MRKLKNLRYQLTVSLSKFQHVEKKKRRSRAFSLDDTSRVDDYNKIEVNFFNILTSIFFECLKCKENQGHPDYKKHIWSRNYKYHYKHFPFGCSSTHGTFSFWIPQCLLIFEIGNHIRNNRFILGVMTSSL